MGLKTSNVSDRYGSPADIKIKQRYLLQSTDAPSGVDWSWLSSVFYNSKGFLYSVLVGKSEADIAKILRKLLLIRSH